MVTTSPVPVLGDYGETTDSLSLVLFLLKPFQLSVIKRILRRPYICVVTSAFKFKFVSKPSSGAAWNEPSFLIPVHTQGYEWLGKPLASPEGGYKIITHCSRMCTRGRCYRCCPSSSITSLSNPPTAKPSPTPSPESQARNPKRQAASRKAATPSPSRARAAQSLAKAAQTPTTARKNQPPARAKSPAKISHSVRVARSPARTPSTHKHHVARESTASTTKSSESPSPKRPSKSCGQSSTRTTTFKRNKTHGNELPSPKRPSNSRGVVIPMDQHTEKDIKKGQKQKYYFRFRISAQNNPGSLPYKTPENPTLLKENSNRTFARTPLSTWNRQITRNNINSQAYDNRSAFDAVGWERIPN
ncbi:hypothetical protein VP01_426g2 [Puccinia sorghi]|uniref:Uncharacterized protein n=1 Tax=Puccinia sorghi TaxID=27349 RepID=A0A0L6UQB0_9BASI|nr:hypothetical protein VP01_426g2 [Puccinia sorghi]